MSHPLRQLSWSPRTPEYQGYWGHARLASILNHVRSPKVLTPLDQNIFSTWILAWAPLTHSLNYAVGTARLVCLERQLSFWIENQALPCSSYTVVPYWREVPAFSTHRSILQTFSAQQPHSLIKVKSTTIITYQANLLSQSNSHRAKYVSPTKYARQTVSGSKPLALLGKASWRVEGQDESTATFTMPSHSFRLSWKRYSCEWSSILDDQVYIDVDHLPYNLIQQFFTYSLIFSLIILEVHCSRSSAPF